MNNPSHDFTNLLYIYAVDIGENSFPMEFYWSCKNFFVLKPLDKALLEILQNPKRLKELKEKAKRKILIEDGASKFLYLKNLIKLAMDEKSHA